MTRAVTPAAAALLLLALSVPGRAHERASSLDGWGGFGTAAGCQVAVAAAAERCAAAAIGARGACIDASSCGRDASAALVAAARRAAVEAVTSACDEQAAAALGRRGVYELLVGTIDACRSAQSAAARASELSSVRDLSDAERRCVASASDEGARLTRVAVAAWRRAFDAIAVHRLGRERKEKLAARAARRIERARTALGNRVAAACDGTNFAALYGTPAENLFAEVAQAGSCFAEDVYAQSAATCARAHASLAAAGTACTGGFAGEYPCRSVDLLAAVPLSALGGGSGNDIWGWTASPAAGAPTGREFALVGRSSGLAMVEITNPTAPVYLGNLPTQTFNSLWRGVKVYDGHALVVSESGSHGMQVFDLSELLTMSGPPRTFVPTAVYAGFTSAHNIAIDEASGFAYAVGTTTCGRGLHIVDVREPAAPRFAGCYGDDGYTHDTQCTVYAGPDAAYVGRQICFNSNEDTLTVVDVTNKSAPALVSRTPYLESGYTHQGWLTADHRYFLMDDELDEQRLGFNTRTRIWDVRDLNAPAVIGWYTGRTRATDHNLYVRGNYAFAANYRSGLSILDVRGAASASLAEVGYFDVHPADDEQGFQGAWSVYPFFPSGSVVVNSIERGLFVLRPSLDEAPTPTSTPTPTATPTPLPAGPVAAWSFEESAADSSGNGNALALQGDATWGAGAEGAGLALDGAGDTARAADSASLGVTGAGLTIEAWVKPRAVDGYRVLAHKEKQYTLAIKDGKLTYADSATWSYAAIGSYGNVPAALWTHVAASFDGAVIRFWINGELVGSKARAGSIADNANPLCLGGYDCSRYFFSGRLDEVRIHPRALAAAEIRASYRAVDAERFAAAWSFEEGAQTSAADSSGNGNTAALENGATWAPGALGGALGLAGNDERARAAASPSLGVTGTGLTIEAWVKPQAVDGYRVVAHKEKHYTLAIKDGKLTYADGATWSYATIGLYGTVPAGTWTHVAVTFDGAAIRFWVGGVLVGSKARAGSIVGSAEPLCIGAYGCSRYWFAGEIDEVRIYRRALGAQEILERREVLP